MENLLVAIFWLNCGLLIIFLRWPWQWLWTDWARQRLFAERDALFDLGLAGKIEFDAPQYREARKAIENFIRFAHRLTLRQLVIGSILGITNGSVRAKLDHSLASVPDEETRSAVRRHVLRSARTVVIMGVARMPILFIPYFILKFGPIRLRQWLLPAARRVENRITAQAEIDDILENRLYALHGPSKRRAA